MKESTPIIIREATNEDTVLLPDVEAAADKLFTSVGIPNSDPPASVEELKSAKAILVAGDPPVGFARIDEVDGNAHLEQLSVAPDFGGQGIGTQLLEEACNWAMGNGYDMITLSTFKDIKWNAPFYAKHGFEIIDELTPGLVKLKQHEVDLGLDKLGTRVVMRKNL